MTRTWLGITERKAERVERRTEYAVRYIAERRRGYSDHLRRLAATTQWTSSEDSLTANIGEFIVTLRREPHARWSLSIAHPPTGFSAHPPRWEQSLDDAKAGAILHVQLAQLDLAEYRAQLIS
jgi:hypothetical protein